MRPPFRYFGAKGRLAPTLVGMLPSHSHYVEPFAGSAAVLFAKPRSRLETINDVDGDVTTLFRVLRDETDELVRAVLLTPYSRAEFNRCAFHRTPADATDLERARRFLVRQWQAMGSASRHSGWSATITESAVHVARVHRWGRLPERLESCAQRLLGVQIEQADWREILDRYDRPGVAFFIDPPYAESTRAGTMRAYAHEMTEDDHAELVGRLLALNHASSVVTHYPHPVYERLTDAGWAFTDVAVKADSPSKRRQVDRVERVWRSVDLTPQFDFAEPSADEVTS